MISRQLRVKIDSRMHAEVAVAALAALGHGLRLEIWRLLAPYGPLGLAAGAISAHLEIPPSSLSFHLQQMTQGKVLVQRRSSRQIIYAVNNEVINSLCNFLANQGKPDEPLNEPLIPVECYPPANPALPVRQTDNIIG